jgi:hypothetical protein
MRISLPSKRNCGAGNTAALVAADGHPPDRDEFICQALEAAP